MNFLKRLGSLFTGGGASRGDKRYLTIYVLSHRCNEPISGQVDLLNELSKPDEGEYAYYTRKVLHTTGDHRCFSQVEVNLYFNQDKQVMHHEVEGGRWLTSDEYAQELERFNAPPPGDEPEDEAAPVEEHSQTGASTEDEPASSGTTSPDPELNPQPTPKEDDHA